jgi:hypothetical protein
MRVEYSVGETWRDESRGMIVTSGTSRVFLKFTFEGLRRPIANRAKSICFAPPIKPLPDPGRTARKVCGFNRQDLGDLLVCAGLAPEL